MLRTTLTLSAAAMLMLSVSTMAQAQEQQLDGQPSELSASTPMKEQDAAIQEHEGDQLDQSGPVASEDVTGPDALDVADGDHINPSSPADASDQLAAEPPDSGEAQRLAQTSRPLGEEEQLNQLDPAAGIAQSAPAAELDANAHEELEPTPAQ